MLAEVDFSCQALSYKPGTFSAPFPGDGYLSHEDGDN